MEWADLTAAVATIIILTVCFWVLPALSAPTLPLGVSVPTERAGDPVVKAAIHSYREQLLASTAFTILVAAGLAFTAPALAALLPTLLLVVLGGLSVLMHRKHITATKLAQGWLAQSGTATLVRHGIPWTAFVMAVGILLATAGYGVYRYPAIPPVFATHWGFSGTADGFSTKSVGSVFLTVFIGLGLLAVMLGASWQTAKVRLGSTSGGGTGRTADESAAHAIASNNAAQTFLGIMAVAVSVLMAVASFTIWSASGTSWPIYIALLVLLLGLVAGGLTSRRQFARDKSTLADAAGHGSANTGLSGAQSPGSDRSHTPAAQPPSSSIYQRSVPEDGENFWVAGIIYNNPADKRVWVPKRMGMGLTVNWATTGGKLFFLVVAALIALGPVLAAVSGHAH